MFAQIKRFRHISGFHHRFIKLEGRHYWLPVNDDNWQEHNSAVDFTLATEPLYVWQTDQATQQAEHHRFRELATAWAQQQLEGEAINEIKRDLQAIYAEQQLEQLLEAFHHYLQQDDLYR